MINYTDLNDIRANLQSWSDGWGGGVFTDVTVTKSVIIVKYCHDGAEDADTIGVFFAHELPPDVTVDMLTETLQVDA